MIKQPLYIEDREKLEKLWPLFGGDHHNHPPPNLREVDEAEIVQRSPFLSYHHDFETYKQVLADKPGGGQEWLSLHLLLYHDGTGIGMTKDHQNKRVRWFRFGCEHTYRGLDQKECAERGIYHAGRCYHVSECTKCHHVRAVDSSD